MYTEYRDEIFDVYNAARSTLIDNPNLLISLEECVTDICRFYLKRDYDEFEADYNEASFLHPFWANYPPEDRGRAPKGDQIPWIEVGEHAIGHKLSRIIAQDFSVREVGIPSGADNRFIISSHRFTRLTDGLTNSVMAFIDIKSVGPRDDQEHTVISPYQVSGDGIWDNPEYSMINSKMVAVGSRASHPFFPAVAPIYVLSDGTIAPTIHVFIKPVYRMLGLEGHGLTGQPLNHIRIICVPNGLLLTQNPNYLRQYPGLFFPGKDDKSKPEEKMRCRVSFDLLHRIDSWRVVEATD